MAIIKKIFVAAICISTAASLSYCASITVDELITQYNKATDLQRTQILGDYQYKTISVSGIVENVEEWDIFDERNQVKKTFYRVTTQSTQIDPTNYYNVSIFYKDRAEADKLNRGQVINIEGILVKIITEPGSFSIWVYPGEISEEDKIMFAQ